LNNYKTVIAIILLTLFLGIIAGSYPAFFISAYEPIKVLHGIFNRGLENQRLRSVFVVFQFTVATLIIIMTLVVFAQIDLMLSKELGFVKERILVIRRPDALKDRIDDFKKEILKNTDIESVANSNSIPGRTFISSSYFLNGDSSRQNYLMNQIFVSYAFREAFSLQMKQGRFFSRSVDADTAACVINEAAMRELGIEDPVGLSLEMPGMMKKIGHKFKVIGVVKDFHFETVDKEIEPLVISLMPGNWEGFLNVRLSSSSIDKSIKFLETTWEKYTNRYPFLYFFLDEDFDKNYRTVERTGRILMIFSSLSIFVACLGLFGLISFTTNQRVHEIGIRKSLGANFLQIMYLLLKEILVMIVVATGIASIIAFIVSKVWLGEFYTRISHSPKYFLLAMAITLTLSLLVVLTHCYKASRQDPYLVIHAE
jgi:putative ABC transport system permease protein